MILVTGVNGSGKTTTIGKMAWHLQKELGRSVLLAAGDTFRAAAAEQLTLWAERAGCEIVRGEAGSDPGAVVYDALDAAEARGHDVVIVDTAGPAAHPAAPDGRAAQDPQGDRRAGSPDAPHETLLTIDATTGQNGLRQALLFREAVDVTGIALTKLDGTAKGGIALAIAQELGVPVKLIGVGEALEDLRPFDAGRLRRGDPRAVDGGPAARHRRDRLPGRRAAAPGARAARWRPPTCRAPRTAPSGVEWIELDVRDAAGRALGDRARAAGGRDPHRLPPGRRGRAGDHRGRRGRRGARPRRPRAPGWSTCRAT